MKIALCQINPIIGDFDYNLLLIEDAAEHARKAGCSLAIFPELSLPGYPPNDLLERPGFIAEGLRRLDQLASRTNGIQILCGYVDRNPKPTGKRLINAAALIGDGRILLKGGKRLLPTYDVFDESRYFEPEDQSLLFKLEGRRIGVTICEDTWNFGDFQGMPHYGSNPTADLQARGMDLLINISASPYVIGKGHLRMDMLKNICVMYHIPTLYCNQVGGNDELLFDGSSMVVDRRGGLVLLGKEFDKDIIIWDDEDAYTELKDPWSSEEESVLNGLTMGTRDYIRKCGFRKALVGLSGGIDSSLVAVIAQRALGPENVTGVSMPSRYTSDMSKEDARRLAQTLGINFKEIPIDLIFETYLHALAPLFEGMREDETEENIQARIRGTLLMALSNKFKAIVLTTGNKSELAMGYCTLYGDMSGGLAVISDIPKTMCYRLARHINRDEIIIPERVLQRPPSAELRVGQTDFDTLPPYEIVDRIVEASVTRNLGLEEIISMGYDPAVVRDLLLRLTMNEYKRRQAPPGLKITSKAFGFGRRYPIARGLNPY